MVLELEDGVALTAKAQARTQATEALNKYINGAQPLSCFELGLRVNSVSSGLLEDDIKVRHFSFSGSFQCSVFLQMTLVRLTEFVPLNHKR